MVVLKTIEARTGLVVVGLSFLIFAVAHMAFGRAVSAVAYSEVEVVAAVKSCRSCKAAEALAPDHSAVAYLHSACQREVVDDKSHSVFGLVAQEVHGACNLESRCSLLPLDLAAFGASRSSSFGSDLDLRSDG